MSEVTKDEAREAATRLDRDEASNEFRAASDRLKDFDTLATFARQELSRRDAERAEREKPIDEEWLESIGFYRDTTESRYFENQHIAGAFYVRNSGVLVWRCEVYELFEANTRGQLLDLLAALKGGE